MAKSAARKSGIGRKIGRLVALAVFASVLSAAITLALVQTKRDLAAHRTSAESSGYVLAAATADAVQENDAEQVRRALRSVSRMQGILMVVVFNNDGRAIASLGQATYLEKDIVTTGQSELSMLFKGALPVSVDIVKGGASVGRLVLLTNVHAARTTFLSTIAITLLAALITSLAGVLLSRPLQSRIVRPLVRLTQTISTIRASRDYSHNISEAQATDEVAILIDSFNGLMGDIRRRDSALQKIAFVDTLTGLGNRAHFQRVLDEWTAETAAPGEAGAAIIFNLHGFSSINDAFGESIADSVVLSVAAAMHAALDQTSDFARVGTHEFGLLLRTRENSAALCEEKIAQMHALFTEPLKILHFELHVSLSAGAVLLPAEGLKPDGSSGIMRAAQLALNIAKQKGPGKTVYYSPLMDETARREAELGQSLRHAIEHNELQAYYQPFYDLRTNRVSGFEALARWKHPIKGMISPAEFIPVAERTGLIAPLGEWMLAEACHQAKSWLKEGEAPRVMSVNVSPAQLLDADFVSKVEAALHTADLPPSLLCLEVTESLFMGDSTNDVQAILHKVSALGVKLALDDFGTGYSSLGTLSKLPFDKLKIDRSFVTEAEKSDRKQGLLASVISMAHGLKMTVVTEGAETIHELDLLRRLRADEVQGYVVSRPLPASEALAMTREIEARSSAARAVA